MQSLSRVLVVKNLVSILIRRSARTPEAGASDRQRWPPAERAGGRSRPAHRAPTPCTAGTAGALAMPIAAPVVFGNDGGEALQIDELMRGVDQLPPLNAVAMRAGGGRFVTNCCSAEEPMRLGGVRWLLTVEAKGAFSCPRGRDRGTQAVLLAPDQVFFLRENLKLKLLSARLALLSRQMDTARSEIAGVAASLNRYFDPASRFYPGGCATLLQQVAVPGEVGRAATYRRHAGRACHRCRWTVDRSCVPRSGYSHCLASQSLSPCLQATTRARLPCSGHRGGSIFR